MEPGAPPVKFESTESVRSLEGEMAKYRDVIEIQSDSHRVLSSHVLDDDGNWRQYMTVHYRRQR
jgi:hypothetical protein